MPKTGTAEKAKTPPARSKSRKEGIFRYVILAMLFLSVIGFYTVRLVGLQLTSPDGATVTIGGEKIAVTRRVVTVKARRGSILDTNGTPLVQDVMRYQLELDAASFPKDDAAANALIYTLLTLLDAGEDEVRASSLPITWGYADDRYLYFLKPETVSQTARARFETYLTTIGLENTAELKAKDVLDAMYTRYHLYESAEVDGLSAVPADAPKNLLYDSHMAYRIACIRYDLEVMTFDTANPYRLADEVDLSLITPVREQNLRGVNFRVQSEREYCYPGYASHILGRTGRIQASKVDYYTALGYPLDAVVGIDGIEGAMEESLRGIDGKMLVEEDIYGNVLRQTVIEEAVPGKDVYLTIDIDLQIKAEDALAANIAYIVESALSSGEPQSGEDANAGALVVVDPDNGAILASASYPTYDLTAFDYTALSSDPMLPLYNRALMGTYAPGSVFKVGVAAAAMENGIIAADTKIDTKGVYTFYDDYQPRCWLFTRTGLSHGPINVIEALRDSCNYFFFDVGRQLGISKLSTFMSSLGLGQKTGVELPEAAGILSAPAYTDSRGLPWVGADTLQTSIGQGYNAYTPMQLAVYLSTLVNGGTRYEAHFVKGIAEHDNPKPKFSKAGTVLDKIALDEQTYDTLIAAMREVAENGSATRVFRGYGVSVGAKTGTAEVGDGGSPNAVFAGFAPLNNPQLLAVSIIENGASGTSAGLCVRDVFDEWFGK
ncbi:MAG: hypothetical protein IKZ09_10680 [Clostridia bacterium]|nr:hypothetical protein [Clostridia bacterium]